MHYFRFVFSEMVPQLNLWNRKIPTSKFADFFFFPKNNHPIALRIGKFPVSSQLVSKVNAYFKTAYNEAVVTSYCERTECIIQS